MEKVVISKLLADKIVKYEREFDERVKNDECIEEFVIGEILNDCYLKDDLKISLVTLARAIEEGYEVERDYLTLEQVLELPSETIIMHERFSKPTYIFIVKKQGEFTYLAEEDCSRAKLEKWMLTPKWYIVK